jgi:hypothetical protein
MFGTILLLVAVAGSGACAQIGAGDGADNRSGAGMTYRGTFYNLSSFEVDPGSLGPLLDRQVPFQDTRIDLRRIRGVAPSRAVAGFTQTFPGTGSPDPRAWLLLSPDATLAADPRTDAVLRTVVLSPDRG